jgi:hypothetical protein
MFMRGAATAILQHKTVVLKGQTMRLKFANPAAVERHNVAGAFGNRQRHGQAIDLPGLRAQIG